MLMSTSSFADTQINIVGFQQNNYNISSAPSEAPFLLHYEIDRKKIRVDEGGVTIDGGELQEWPSSSLTSFLFVGISKSSVSSRKGQCLQVDFKRGAQVTFWMMRTYDDVSIEFCPSSISVVDAHSTWLLWILPSKRQEDSVHNLDNMNFEDFAGLLRSVRVYVR